jgi:hypothetical protein
MDNRPVEMPGPRPYDAGLGSGSAMLRRWMVILGVIAMGIAVSGCTKCGPIWDDWMQSPKSCKSDRL